MRFAAGSYYALNVFNSLTTLFNKSSAFSSCAIASFPLSTGGGQFRVLHDGLVTNQAKEIQLLVAGGKVTLEGF
ncbi:MAG: hypothetical protein IJQ81_09050 [Oscillibacter sp.]|nr:hypothetical protein [Oscillibacter sp.]